MQMVPYELKYWSEVKKLAQKYFHYPDNYDYTWRWGGTLYHPWTNTSEFPFANGLVLINNDEKVVGFFGCFFSKRLSLENKSYNYLNLSRWILEDDYRKYYFSVIKTLFKDADIISDYSAINSVKESFINIYKFKLIDMINYRFFPIPYMRPKTIEVKFLTPDELESNILRKEYSDHLPYGMKCVSFTDGIERGYVIYRYKEQGAQIVKVVNKKLMGLKLHEIIWEIQKHAFTNKEKIPAIANEVIECIKGNRMILCECDSRFLKCNDIAHPLYTIKNVNRLVLNKIGVDIDIDNLYSETSIGYTAREQALLHLPVNSGII